MEPEGGFAETLFITFGLYLFAVGGPSYVVPNVAVFARDPSRMSYVVACVFAGIGVLYTVSGNCKLLIWGCVCVSFVRLCLGSPQPMFEK